MAGEARSGGKLLLTGGVSTIEGSAGAGLATWSMIAGNETEDGIGGKVHATGVALSDFELRTYGAAIGIRNRVEISYARQDFDTGKAGALLGLGRGFTFGQDIFGLKVRVAGDSVYDQDRALPQVSVGIQYKRSRQDAIVRAVGGQHTAGVDYVVSASKVLLAHSAVLGGSVRFTKANQFGLLGFGGDKRDKYRAQFEGSAGLLLSRNLLIGGEYRTKPDNLGFAKEDDAHDAFVAWAPQRHITVTLAYTDVGHIATFRRQRGGLLSLQGSF
ncbi:DUF3034 family protein [Sphingomonas antarctica]|uniref:DUF3034 family protein n=1 Tax=Sphingomonas antarctica TaxID=2040274 RepID=UPI0039ECA392